MPVLHHGIHILEIPDSTMREQLMQSPVIQQAVIMEVDNNHWLIDGQYIYLDNILNGMQYSIPYEILFMVCATISYSSYKRNETSKDLETDNYFNHQINRVI